MAKLNLNKLQGGMVTLSEVVDKNGHTLIRANEELSDKHILLLKMWGVLEVDIKKTDDFISSDIFSNQYSEEAITSAKLLAEKKFQFHDQENKAAIILKKYFIEQELEGSKF